MMERRLKTVERSVCTATGDPAVDAVLGMLRRRGRVVSMKEVKAWRRGNSSAVYVPVRGNLVRIVAEIDGRKVVVLVPRSAKT